MNTDPKGHTVNTTATKPLRPATARKISECVALADRLGYTVERENDGYMTTRRITDGYGDSWMIATINTTARTYAHRSVYGQHRACSIVEVYRDLHHRVALTDPTA